MHREKNNVISLAIYLIVHLNDLVSQNICGPIRTLILLVAKQEVNKTLWDNHVNFLTTRDNNLPLHFPCCGLMLSISMMAWSSCEGVRDAMELLNRF